MTLKKMMKKRLNVLIQIEKIFETKPWLVQEVVFSAVAYLSILEVVGHAVRFESTVAQRQIEEVELRLEEEVA